jgi:hypothetical protein
VATPACGWEIDDIVRWLEDEEGTFDELQDVERSSPFEAKLSFRTEEAANGLVEALRSDSVPAAMRSAIEELGASGTTTHIRFTAVDEVQLTERGEDHVAACILDPGSRPS